MTPTITASWTMSARRVLRCYEMRPEIARLENALRLSAEANAKIAMCASQAGFIICR
jgi:hypothetical protein